MKYTAIILAAGNGSRMNTKVKKQYLQILGKPLLYYTLQAFEESFVDEVILVVSQGETPYCRKQIVDFYGFQKVAKIVEGGKERYHSVYEGLKAVKDADYVMIHDSARPFVTDEILNRAKEGVEKYRACVVGMPVKDTIKIADENGYSKETPERKKVWMIQTPQCFEYALIREAYKELLQKDDCSVTDDAMVIEKIYGMPVKLIEGSYSNLKITTQEDLITAEAYLRKKSEFAEKLQ